MHLRIAALLIVAVFSGCSMWPFAKPPSPVVGIWFNRVGAMWTIKDDGTFDVDLTRDGKPDTTGTYTVDGDKLTMKATDDRLPKNCMGEGVYRFQRNGPELSFKLVHDDCKLRRTNVLLGWRMKH